MSADVETFDEANSEAEVRRFVVDEADAGKRLDAFLAEKLTNLSRARLQRLIESGDVLIDERTAKSSHKVRAAQIIEVDLANVVEIPEDITPENISLKIIYEDAAIVVVNKPAGMIVHPGAGAGAGTLANALAFHFQNLSQHAGRARPGIVHRLDKDTSGLLVVAKTESAHENLAEQFRRREVQKKYIALAHGRMREETGRIEQPIGRDERNRTRMSVVPKGRGGREALTLFQVRQRFERFTLLDVEIKTGRTHQIRVHLAWIKHPVVGDETYNAGRDKNIPDAALRARIERLGRQFLHAAKLKFRHPQSEKLMEFTAPLPAELREFLDSLN
jgi:23S rRNA pseudouridine1911/1915/1917 synthase